eukprot:1122089-Amphidinium_carterae.1
MSLRLRIFGRERHEANEILEKCWSRGFEVSVPTSPWRSYERKSANINIDEEGRLVCFRRIQIDKKDWRYKVAFGGNE